jgi:hypothetical protein
MAAVGRLNGRHRWGELPPGSQTADRLHAAFRPAAKSLTASVVSGWPPMPHSPLVTSGILTQLTRMFLAFDRHHRIGQFLNYLTLLLAIEYVFDRMNFYQWHCRSPQWYSSLGLMAA